MGLSRRQFTKEFKLGAVRRLEQGVSVRRSAVTRDQGTLSIGGRCIDAARESPAGADA